MLRGTLVTIAAALALASAASGSPTTQSATTTYKCKQAWSSFYVQLIGDRDWGWSLDGLGAVGAPTKKALLAVWSLGGIASHEGLNAYTWSVGSRTRTSDRCILLQAKLKPPSLKGLGPVTRVQDGWAFGRKFACAEPGALLIELTQLGQRMHIVVRLQRSGHVMAVGEIGGGKGWIRGSTRCDSREK